MAGEGWRKKERKEWWCFYIQSHSQSDHIQLALCLKGNGTQYYPATKKDNLTHFLTLAQATPAAPTQAPHRRPKASWPPKSPTTKSSLRYTKPNPWTWLRDPQLLQLPQKKTQPMSALTPNPHPVCETQGTTWPATIFKTPSYLCFPLSLHTLSGLPSHTAMYPSPVFYIKT